MNKWNELKKWNKSNDKWQMIFNSADMRKKIVIKNAKKIENKLKWMISGVYIRTIDNQYKPFLFAEKLSCKDSCVFLDDVLSWNVPEANVFFDERTVGD